MVFNFNEVHPMHCFFPGSCFSDVLTKSKLISICSWAIFWECMALHFVLSSATYSELIFVKFVGSVSGFIFLHVDVQLLQDVPLLQRLSFLH